MQSETESSVATEEQSAPKTIASTAFTDRSTPLLAQKLKFVSEGSTFLSFTEAAEREATALTEPVIPQLIGIVQIGPC